MEIGDELYADVAEAVDLREGEAGVARLVRAIARHEPVAVGALSRLVRLPVPIVAATCNELRTRGVVSRTRPVQLDPKARDALHLHTATDVTRCPTCSGRGTVVPEIVASIAGELERIAEATPAARVELDQTHATVETKLRRALLLNDLGALDDTRVVLLGDDDITSIAIAHVVRALGTSGPRELVVVDVDDRLVEFTAAQLADAPFAVEVHAHDLRDPLPTALLERFDVAFTDPPYTAAGGSLFADRAISALKPGSDRDLFFAFGAPVPDDVRAVQQRLLASGLVMVDVLPHFNEYLGAGILGGTSTQYHLRTTSAPRADSTERVDDAIYTADARVRAREYRCTQCGHVYRVGTRETWITIAALKERGCEECGNDRFKPSSLVDPSEPGELPNPTE